MSEMVNMTPPWQGVTPEEVSCTVAAGERPVIASALGASAPTGWIELMEQCWDQHPENRPEFDAIHNTLRQIGRNTECGHELDNASSTRATCLAAPRNASNCESEMEMYYSIP